MATGSEILSYRGSGGLGSNADIPAIADKDLTAINQTADRLQMQNAAQNHALFQQKISDRDKLYEALDSGDIKVGSLLPIDRTVVKEGLQKLDDAYFKRIKKGIGDLDAAAEYKDALREAQNIVTQAQARKVFNDAENVALSKEVLPRKQTARKQNLDKSLGSFWADITPYQQTLDYDFDAIKKYPVAQTTELPADPNRPYEKGKRTSFDFDQINRDAQKDFIENNEERENQMGLFNSFQKMPAPEAMRELIPIIRRLEEYNKSKNLKPGDAGYVDANSIVAKNPDGTTVITPEGTLLINKKVPEFAALWSLASVPQFAAETWEADPGKLNVAKHQEDIRSAKAREANDRSKLGLDWSKFNYAKGEDIGGASSVLNEAKDIIDKGIETKIDIGGGKTKTVLRVGDPTLLKQFGNIDKEGNVSNVPDAIEYDREKDQVKLVYYEGQTKSGKNIIGKEVSLDQRTWLKEIAKRSYPNKDIGKVNSLIDDVLTQSGNSLYKLTQSGTKEEPKGSTDYTNQTTLKDSSGNSIQAGVKNGKWYNIKTGKELK